ncbi:MAG TPA: PGF-pre-PGF domain-containing protein, partial [candidate division Zixibacteria bacterium]|nr:PGF-pre-PGF domain-containing protein [candidate division Zixibacteria bacterium]
KYDEAIFKDVVTSYKFKNASNPITHVNVTGNNNAGLITAMIEVLKGTSTLVTENPPGVVYMNVNTWLGTSGYATAKNLKEVVIRFRVSNSWMQSNNVDASDVKLLRWDSTTKKWTTLETEVKEKDGSVTYFEGTTNALSPLAISAVAAAPGGPVAGAPPAATQPAPGEPPGKPAPPQPKGTPGFEIAGVIAAISLLYVLGRKIRR